MQGTYMGAGKESGKRELSVDMVKMHCIHILSENKDTEYTVIWRQKTESLMKQSFTLMGFTPQHTFKMKTKKSLLMKCIQLMQEETKEKVQSTNFKCLEFAYLLSYKPSYSWGAQLSLNLFLAQGEIRSGGCRPSRYSILLVGMPASLLYEVIISSF